MMLNYRRVYHRSSTKPGFRNNYLIRVLYSRGQRLSIHILEVIALCYTMLNLCCGYCFPWRRRGDVRSLQFIQSHQPSYNIPSCIPILVINPQIFPAIPSWSKCPRKYSNISPWYRDLCGLNHLKSPLLVKSRALGNLWLSPQIGYLPFHRLSSLAPLKCTFLAYTPFSDRPIYHIVSYSML